MRKYILFALCVFMVLILTSMTIDLQNLFNYSNQSIPSYITKDNSGSNLITDEGATLGRVLFYDKKLSSNNTIACGSCHLQAFAFGDTSAVSVGVNGVTGRHSMRLINNRFSDEVNYFWDERASSLEIQSTMPIMDHFEMGYSGTNGDPDFQELLEKLNSVSYYNDLFYLTFGDTLITEDKMQLALSQFIRSIQSFDAPYDIGRAQVDDDSIDFPNYSPQENMGKSLFITPPIFDDEGLRIGGGFGCASCHVPPEFNIDPSSKSNGVVFTPGSTTPNGGVDTIVTKSPSLRDIVNQDGVVNGNLMHTANFANLTNVLNHYDRINLFPQVPGIADAIDPRLIPNGNRQDLNMTNQERNRVIRFLETLTGVDVYVNEKWSDPFDENGNLEIINSPLITSTQDFENINFKVYPNPVIDKLNIQGDIDEKIIEIYDVDGSTIQSMVLNNDQISIPFERFIPGFYTVVLKDEKGNQLASQRIVKVVE